MPTTHKTDKEKFDYRINRDSSVEKSIYVELKPRKNWNDGLTLKELKKRIELKHKAEYSVGRIYEAVSLINRYGKNHDIYIRSGYGWVTDSSNNKKVQYRYFVPTEQFDISKEREDLEHKHEVVLMKEEHLEHHEKITIPQEQALKEIPQI